MWSKITNKRGVCMYIDFIEFGRLAKSIRKNLNLTQEEVYKRIGVANETLRRLEKGLQEPKISTLERLSHLYKFDLVSLLATCRNKENFLSESIVHSINKDLIKCDYISLGNTVRNMIQYLISTLNKPSDRDAKLYLIRYLDTFNQTTFIEYRELTKNIINVENLLLFLNNNGQGIGEDPYLYDLETSSIIYLIVMYRQAKSFQKAIAMSYQVIDKIENYPNHSGLQLNHLGALYLNLAYIYHRNDQFKMAIQTIDTALINDNMIFTNHLYNELIIRKAFAYYHLGNPEYKILIDSVLLNCTPEHKRTILKVIDQQLNDHSNDNELNHALL